MLPNLSGLQRKQNTLASDCIDSSGERRDHAVHFAASEKRWGSQRQRPGSGDNMVKIACATLIVVAGTLTAVAQNAGAPSERGNVMVSADVVQDLAPTGKLRAAINLDRKS